MIADRKLPRSDKLFSAVVGWVKNFPSGLSNEDRTEIRSLICKTFSIDDVELSTLIDGGRKDVVRTIRDRDPAEVEAELEKLIPPRGYFRRYIDYTSHSEAPLAYHFYCALVGVAATVNRRVWFDMGYYRLYPSLGVIIVGPSGVKKTSAANIIVDILTKLGTVKIYSEKLTPEALIEAMKGDNATGLIYAPEMAVFLSRQRYMEGIVPLITRFMDCPDRWESGTIMRGNHVLKNVAINSLMCTTADWFISNTPEDTFGGGFIARNIMVVQYSSPREEPIPTPGDLTEAEKLAYELAYVHSMAGQITLSRPALSLYRDWYHDLKTVQLPPEHELLSTYYQRKPDHAKRIAICLHLAHHADLEICDDCFHRAVQILEWTESFLPDMLRDMFITSAGKDTQAVLHAIKAAGGVIPHSRLIHKLQYRMDAQRVRSCIGSLKEAGVVRELVNNVSHTYEVIDVEHSD